MAYVKDIQRGITTRYSIYGERSETTYRNGISQGLEVVFQSTVDCVAEQECCPTRAFDRYRSVTIDVTTFLAQLSCHTQLEILRGTR